jgi:acetyl-CoA carboxylase beta subunit
MNLRTPLQHFHGEHAEIIEFLKNWEQALDLAVSADPEQRCQGLRWLREMRGRVTSIREHCREEEQSARSAFRLYLDDEMFEQLRTEHDMLERISDDYLEELEAATAPPPAERLVEIGRRLVEQLHRHIVFEEKLLEQACQSADAEEKLMLRYTQPAE